MASARRKARKRALDVLYEAEQRRVPPLEVLAQRRTADDPPVGAFTTTLVEGVVAHAAEIDVLVSQALSASWSLRRLPAVDRALLRLGTYELRFGGEVEPGVAISEAVGLAAELSTDDSAAYVNGVLAAISRAEVGSAPEPALVDPPQPVTLPDGAELA